MIDLGKYRTKFRERCLAAGFTELNEPIDTDAVLYCAFEIQDVDNKKDFDCMFFEPTIAALIKSIAEEDKGEFYRLDVGQKNNIIVFLSSRGNNPIQWKLDFGS